MNIVILDAYSVNPGDIDWAPIRAFGELTIYDHTLPEQIAERIREANAVFTNRVRMGEEEFAKAHNLRFLCLFATGYDKIDLSAAKRHSIAVCNAPGYSTDAVAQHAIALLLEITNRTHTLDGELRKGRWTQHEGDCVWDAPILSLSGKTFGVFGTGAIGCRTAEIAKALGMRVLGSSRNQRAAFCGEYVSLHTLFSESDVLSLHCAATKQTQGIINRDTLSRMKPTAILINTARGSLIDSAALASALNAGAIYAAGLDVVDREPILPENPLLKAKNCLITPHAAWLSKDVRTRLIEITAQNLQSFLDGGALNRVDLEG